MEKLCLFNIQKFSLHDGPGIRTTVFFKGCPLACKWCSNPESQEVGVQPDRSEELRGKLYDIKEVVDICLEDKPFYSESGGGVTLSGGEVLLQPEAATALFKGLHLEGIHTALETAGLASPEVFEQVSSEADIILFDMKHYDSQKHKEGTGSPNEVILENLRNAQSAGNDILVRIPVIPDFNDSLDDATGFARLINSIGKLPVQLLPFHQFGMSKYEQLGIPYDFASVSSLHEEDLLPFRDELSSHGIECFI
jgi:pyruvate formate lyase activating enzyme